LEPDMKGQIRGIKNGWSQKVEMLNNEVNEHWDTDVHISG
jgi:hypothetical protein